MAGLFVYLYKQRCYILCNLYNGDSMLGLCCQWLESRVKRDGSITYFNAIEEKTLQLGAYQQGKYSIERIKETYHHNVDSHIALIPKLKLANIHSFRLTSGLFPLWEFLGEDYAKNDQQLISKLNHLGKLFTEAGIRVSCHPGQFTVISSDSDRVVANSIRELEYHAWVFDMMNLPRSPYAAINIHGGKADRSDRIKEVYSSLHDMVKSRLTLENDERCYNVKQLLDIHEHTGIPVVLDSHHYAFNSEDYSFDDAFILTQATWGNNIKPLQHLSNTEPGMENGSFNERRAHSRFIHYIPSQQLEAIKNNSIDVDVEAKEKNLAIFKMRKDFELIS